MPSLLRLVSQGLTKYPGLDPKAVLAVASQEGLSGGIGDAGHAFGPFQLNDAGGVITGKFPGRSPEQLQQWASSPAGINYALAGIANVARGLRGPAAVKAIVNQFERPADKPGEIAGANAAYGSPGTVPTMNMPGQAAVPGASPRLPTYNMPPAPTNFTSTILGALNKGPNALMNAITQRAITGSAQDALHPLSTPAQQAKATNVKSGTTPTGTPVEVQGDVTPSDLKMIKLAEHFIGTPYSWGGGGPGGPSYGTDQGASIKGFDCSSLMQYVWAKQGVSIPRTTFQQWDQGTPVPKNQVQPGDAVYFTGSDPQDGKPGHVGMYIGNGKFIEAPYTGANIRISEMSSRNDYVGARTFV